MCDSDFPPKRSEPGLEHELCGNAIYIYTHIHIYIYTHIHIYIYTYIHIYIYTYIHIYIYTYIHIYIYTYTRIHVYTYIHMTHDSITIYTYIHVYMYTCMHIQMYTSILARCPRSRPSALSRIKLQKLTSPPPPAFPLARKSGAGGRGKGGRASLQIRALDLLIKLHCCFHWTLLSLVGSEEYLRVRTGMKSRWSFCI